MFYDRWNTAKSQRYTCGEYSPKCAPVSGFWGGRSSPLDKRDGARNMWGILCEFYFGQAYVYNMVLRISQYFPARLVSLQVPPVTGVPRLTCSSPRESSPPSNNHYPLLNQPGINPRKHPQESMNMEVVENTNGKHSLLISPVPHLTSLLPFCSSFCRLLIAFHPPPPTWRFARRPLHTFATYSRFSPP